MMKMLGPWPILQFMFGLAILGGGVWMIIRGTQKKDSEPAMLEDRRSEWQAYEQLRNIEENSYKQVEYLRRIHEELQRLNSIVWNQGKM